MPPSRGGRRTEFAQSANQKLLQTGSSSDVCDGVFRGVVGDTDSVLTSDKATSIAACFLMDFEAGRLSSFQEDFSSISNVQLRSYQIVYSTWWRWIFLYPATILMFSSSLNNRFWTVWVHFYSVIIFAIDLGLKKRLVGNGPPRPKGKGEDFISRAMTVFLLAIVIQSIMWLIWANPDEHFSTVFASLFKPLIFFYLSQRARDALEAIVRISRILVKVVAIELFLILIFAAVACRLFYEDEAFENLAISWLSLFQLSTTVVNPSLWMSVYSSEKINAIFFVVFIVVCVFYLHSLILSVVFQVFIQAATEVHDRSSVDKEDSMRCCYQGLSEWQMQLGYGPDVNCDIVREMLAKLRPHYGDMKLDILMELINPSKKSFIGYNDFRTTLREALQFSVRSTRKASIFGNGIEMVSVVVTVVNFLFVALLTSRYQAEWFNASMVTIGSLITVSCFAELAMRFNFCTLTYYPMARLNAVFDSFAAIGAMLSFFGIFLYIARGNQKALNYLYTGRAVDMIRSMRFFPMFGEVVERSIHVAPALIGPVLLVFTTVHVFVYIGMLLWGGQVDAEELSTSEYLQAYYSLNNFNSYPEGLVTVFNVMVVNDWHEIARVFLFAERFSQPYIVYTYFVVVVLIAVCIMLNVITAFFVETFVTRLSKVDMKHEGVIASEEAQVEFNVSTPKRNSSKTRIVSRRDLALAATEGKEFENISLRESGSSDTAEILHFGVFERQGFDRVMQAVGNLTSDQQNIAKCVCDTFHSISMVAPRIGQEMACLVCCLPALGQVHTPNFQSLVSEFLNQDALHGEINELAGQLASSKYSSTSTSSVLERHFRHATDGDRSLSLSAMALTNVEGIVLFIAVCSDQSLNRVIRS